MSASKGEDGVGCLILLAIMMMVCGGLFMAGPIALVYGGAALLALVILGTIL